LGQLFLGLGLSFGELALGFLQQALGVLRLTLRFARIATGSGLRGGPPLAGRLAERRRRLIGPQALQLPAEIFDLVGQFFQLFRQSLQLALAFLLLRLGGHGGQFALELLAASEQAG
jgi:hypothetical protein